MTTPPCPHLSHLDRAAGLTCGCGERLIVRYAPPRNSRLKALMRVIGPYLTVTVALVILGLIAGAIERL